MAALLPSRLDGRLCPSLRMHRRVRPFGRAAVRCQAANDGSDGSGQQRKKASGGSLDDRIASGEFTDAGSTKERMTRPLRKALASDPTGFGTWYVLKFPQHPRV
jgi:hypothetical protein